MNKRIRKKTFKGEYRFAYFEVGFIAKAGVTEDQLHDLVVRSIRFGTTHNRLWFAPGFTCDKDGRVINMCSALACRYAPDRHKPDMFPNSSVFEADRAIVRDWLEAQPEVKEAWVGRLIRWDEHDFPFLVNPHGQTLPEPVVAK